MAKLRKFCAYRRLDRRPNTRFSKYSKKNYVRVRPVCRVVSFTIGNSNTKYDTTLNLLSTKDLQIRDNAIESARQSCNKLLEGTCGKDNYFLQVRMYPHHVMRENPLASGAGADRMSTGMAFSFGKPIGVAAQIRKGKTLITVRVNKEHTETAKQALKRASYKLPCHCQIEIEQPKKIAAAIERPKKMAAVLDQPKKIAVAAK
jgi:large subunit ribosomal protein L10e